MRVHEAKVGPNTSDPKYPFVVAVWHHAKNAAVLVTVGVFKKEEDAHAWANKTVTLYNAFSPKDAQTMELPDDWDKDRAC